MERAEVLLRCRNSAPYVGRTLRSVLEQTGVDASVLAIDDASTDGTVDDVRAMADARVTLIERRSVIGHGRCLNQLLRLGDAPYVITVPDDGVLLPGALLRMIEALERSPRVGLAYAAGFALEPDGSVTREKMRRRARRHAGWTAQRRGIDYLVAFGQDVLGPVAFRRAALDEVGGFDETCDGEATLATLFRIAQRHDCHDAGLLCARGRGASRWYTSLPWRFRAHRRSAPRNGRSASAVTACLAVLGGTALAEARNLGWAARTAVRTFVIWNLLVPASERLHRHVLAHWSSWPIGVMRARRRLRATPRRIAYYLWRYPVLSETFIARELVALEAAGVDVRVIADAAEYGPPTGAGHLPRVRRTEYLEPVPRGQSFRDLARAVVRRPLRTINLLVYVVSHAYQPAKSLRDDGHVFLRALRLASVLRSRRIEHVHVPWGNVSAFIAMIAARLAGVDFSVQFRAHEIHRRTAAFLIPDKIRHARFVATNSRFNQRHLRALVDEDDRAKIHQIYNGLDLGSFDAPVRSPEPTRPTILSVARLIEAKGLPDLFEACRGLHERGYRVHCEIVGAPELPLYVNDYLEIKSWHRRLGVGEFVTFLGPLPFSAVLERYRHADIFVLPSVVARDGSNDITPNALLEAMAMRLPVVSTTITAIAEIVDDGVSGLLVPPRNPGALQEAIARLLDDPDLRHRLGENARRRVEERFDIRANIQAYVDLFRAS
ncbi:MAG TPA: glycosyltransferase [Candidatus Methylomirabilis sp.]|nr:glycosyltransferase [Candidatus Methylomirabilis sp.]